MFRKCSGLRLCSLASTGDLSNSVLGIHSPLTTVLSIVLWTCDLYTSGVTCVFFL